ncbi:hypothetical protein [Bacteroides sp. 214]|uniref:hypothetical protein n=1 Tax=Bacteroides sp. 214 TaxID=2302935 RepID=UPI0013D3785F|nr:hypothetical protein [Bacteroides sp. 214]
MNSLKNNSCILIFINIVILILASCSSNDYLKEAVESDAYICPLIHTENSEIILLALYSETLVRELAENCQVKNAEDFVLKCLREGTSIRVSTSFYEKYSQYRIKADSLIDKTYREDGIRGLFDNYIKKGIYDDGLYVLWNAEEMFPLVGHEPYPAFGKDTNKNYLIYLFSKHNLFFLSGSVEHIYMIYLESSISDMSALQ